MRILLTNDDGIDAPGLAALYRAVTGLGTVYVVAPARIQSATSHAVTFHRPIAVRKQGLGLAVDGRPADCVKLGLHAMQDRWGGPIDLVISGMNAGANVGINVLYSGTVGAAREASFAGVPAIAVSLHVGDWDHDHWDRAAVHARTAIDALLEAGIDGGTVMNVNVPILDGGREPKGMKVAPAALTRMVIEYEVREDDAGDTTYKINNPMTFDGHDDGTDVAALFAGYVTLTPLHFDTTCETSTAALERRLAERGAGVER